MIPATPTVKSASETSKTDVGELKSATEPSLTRNCPCSVNVAGFHAKMPSFTSSLASSVHELPLFALNQMSTGPRPVERQRMSDA